MQLIYIVRRINATDKVKVDNERLNASTELVVMQLVAGLDVL